MLNALNTKLLIAILAALAGISALLVTMNNTANKNALVLQQQQQAIAQQKAHDAAFRAQVQAARAKSHSYPNHESKTWQHFMP